MRCASARPSTYLWVNAYKRLPDYRQLRSSASSLSIRCSSSISKSIRAAARRAGER